MTNHSRILFAAATALAMSACQKNDMPIKTTSEEATNTSPSQDSAEARGHSLVRVVNAVKDGKSVDVQVEGTPVYTEVAANGVTDYKELNAKTAMLTVRQAGVATGDPITENSEILMDGNRYTAFVVSEDVSKSVLRIVRDDVVPDSGKARIRVLHAAPGGPEIDVTIAGQKDPIFTGVNFKSEAGYKDVEPGLVTLEVRANKASKVLLRVAEVDLRRGTATTVVVTGAAKLAAFKFTDALMAAATPAKP